MRKPLTRQHLYSLGTRDFYNSLVSTGLSVQTAAAYSGRIQAVINGLDTTPESDDFLEKLSNTQAVSAAISVYSPKTQALTRTAWRAYSDYVRESTGVEIASLQHKRATRFTLTMSTPQGPALPQHVIQAVWAIIAPHPDLDLAFLSAVQWGHVTFIGSSGRVTHPAQAFRIELADPRRPNSKVWSWTDRAPWVALASWAASGLPVVNRTGPLVPGRTGGPDPADVLLLQAIRKEGQRGLIAPILPPPPLPPALPPGEAFVPPASPEDTEDGEW